MLFRSKKKEKIKEQTDQLMKRIFALKSSVSIEADFVDFPITFEISEDWQQLKDLCIGNIFFRVYHAGYERINDKLVSCQSIHNFWSEGSVLKGHYHKDADEYIYLVHGALKVVTIDNGVEETNIYDSFSDQPIVILRGVKHIVSAIEESSFTVKFVK